MKSASLAGSDATRRSSNFVFASRPEGLRGLLIPNLIPVRTSFRTGTDRRCLMPVCRTCGYARDPGS
eukprot:scaffold214120_cov46-Prasinocladus_malaysianus.AAC.1